MAIIDYPIVEKEYCNYLGKNKRVDINQYMGKRWKTIDSNGQLLNLTTVVVGVLLNNINGETI